MGRNCDSVTSQNSIKMKSRLVAIVLVAFLASAAAQNALLDAFQDHGDCMIKEISKKINLFEPIGEFSIPKQSCAADIEKCEKIDVSNIKLVFGENGGNKLEDLTASVIPFPLGISVAGKVTLTGSVDDVDVVLTMEDDNTGGGNEGGSNEGGGNESGGNEGGGNEGGGNEGGGNESGGNEGGGNEGGGNESGGNEGGGNEGGGNEGGGNESGGNEGGGNEGGGNEGGGNEGGGNESGGNEGGGNEGGGNESGGNEGGGNEGGGNEGGANEGPSNEGGANEGDGNENSGNDENNSALKRVTRSRTSNGKVNINYKIVILVTFKKTLEGNKILELKLDDTKGENKFTIDTSDFDTNADKVKTLILVELDKNKIKLNEVEGLLNPPVIKNEVKDGSISDSAAWAAAIIAADKICPISEASEKEA